MVNPLSINAGDLRQCLTIVQPLTANVNGVPSLTVTTVLNTRCSIIDASSREIAASVALGGSVTDQTIHCIKLRYSPVTIAPGMMAIVNGHSYSIQSVNNVQDRNRVLRLLVLAVNEAG